MGFSSHGIMMPHSLVAEDAFLITETGPAITPCLNPADDRVWAVDRNGALVLADIRADDVQSEVEAWRLLTPAGDVVVPENTLAMTSDGPMLGRELENRARNQGVVRLDVVTGTDLPPAVPRSADLADIYRSSLAALPRGVVQLPHTDGVADTVGPELEQILQASSVRFRRVEDQRWLAFLLEPLTSTREASRADYPAQLDVLSKATAWANSTEGVESRIRIGDQKLRRRLLAAHVGAGHAFEVKWIPGYYPVESRVRPLGDRSWPARVPVQAVTRESTRVVKLETERAVDLIVSLAVLRPAGVQ